MRSRPVVALAVLALLVALAACGHDASTGGDGPTVVVTTGILGDVVENLVGAAADVQVVMPPGADPHDFQASARQVNEIREADALVTNGGGFEVGLVDALEAAEADGVASYAALDAVSTLTLAGGHPEEGEEAHPGPEVEGEGSGAQPSDQDETSEAGVDPHFFTDPDRMADAAEGIAAFLAEEVPALDTAAVRSGAEAYVAELRRLADSVEETLAVVPEERRVLVTNHDVFGYFADRFGFSVVGAVIPGGGTQGEPSARDLDDLAGVIEAEGVPAIFADTSSPARLADALAAEVGEVEVVELYSESLGPEGSEAATYVTMVETNAQRIAAALR